jgi:uncharacterized repeat protein (TIGR03806 family)
VRRTLAGVLLWVSLAAISPPSAVDDSLIRSELLPPKLSQFHLLLNGKSPNAGVQPYRLNTPLFSDYAEKFRFYYVPKGQTATAQGEGLLDFPVGSVLIKSFGYPADMRKPAANIRILETRLLIRRTSGWIAIPYVWDADGKDATLKRAGARLDVAWTHSDGTPRAISYAVPNVNQCKDCHALDGVMTPIGPKARNLSRDTPIIPATLTAAKIPVWNDPKSGSLDTRARAYLDVNCAHCHNPSGAASNSGLYFSYQQPSGVNAGIGKRPVAAGRGSGDMDFDIAPGHPERSILLYRLASVEPGIAMPELGRATAHKEGLALLTEWIKAMPQTPKGDGMNE